LKQPLSPRDPDMQPFPVRQPVPTIPVPFLNSIFRSWYLKKNAKRARSGDPESARLVARQYCSCPDSAAEACLSSLVGNTMDPVITDTLCQEALESGNDLLYSALCNLQVLPSTPTWRALFFFATGRISDYQSLAGREGRNVLREAYFNAKEPVRECIRNAAERYRAQAFFADMILDPELPNPLSQLSFQEWEIVVAGLMTGSRSEKLYRLLQDAPVPYALHAVRILHGSGWKPEDKYLRELWKRVVVTAPKRWTYPVLSVRKDCVLEGPDARTRFAAFSPDGTLLVTSGYEGTIRIWDVRRGEEIASSGNPENAGCCPIFTPDGNFLLTCSRDGILACREIPSCRIIFTIPRCRSNRISPAISPDGLFAAMLQDDGRIGIVSLKDGAITGSVNTGDAPVTAFAISPDRKYIAIGSDNGEVRLISVSDGTEHWRAPCSYRRIERLAFLPCTTGSGILVAAEKNHPVLLDVTTGSCQRTFSAPKDRPRTTTISDDRRWIFVTMEDDSIGVFSTDQSSPVARIPPRKGGAISSVGIPGESIAVTGGINGIVRIFRFGKDAPEKMFTAHADWVVALAVSPDGKTLASAGWDGTTKLWSLPEGALLRSLDTRAGALTCLAVSGNGTVLAAGTSEGLARFWKMPEGDYLGSLDAFTGSVNAIALNDHGTWVATAGSDANVSIWDLSSKSLVAALHGLKNRTYCLAFTPDDKGILAGGWDDTVRLFGLPDGALLRTFSAHTNVITSIAIANNGKWFVSGSYDGTCRIWDLSIDKEPVLCNGSGREIGVVAISGDGLLIAAAEHDAIIRIFQREDGSCLYSLTGATSQITGLFFIPGGDLLVASGSDGSISCFSLGTRSHIRNFSAHAGKICGLISAGEYTAISAGADGTIRLHSLPLSAPLSSMNPDFTGVITKAHNNSRRLERQQWEFLSAILELRFSHEICLCSPPPSVGELDIMIVE